MHTMHRVKIHLVYQTMHTSSIERRVLRLVFFFSLVFFHRRKTGSQKKRRKKLLIIQSVGRCFFSFFSGPSLSLTHSLRRLSISRFSFFTTHSPIETLSQNWVKKWIIYLMWSFLSVIARLILFSFSEVVVIFTFWSLKFLRIPVFFDFLNVTE